MIEWRLNDKKVLILLDNLDNSDQLLKLVSAPLWFGKGNRIIIITENVDYLVDNKKRPNNDNVSIVVKHEDFYFYENQVIQHDVALKLFRKLAFKSDFPPPEYDDILRKVVATIDRLPLAIKVASPLLCCRGKKTLEDILEKLKKVVHKNVKEKLAISYKDLDCYENEIFLDITYLFINKEKNRCNLLLGNS